MRIKKNSLYFRVTVIFIKMILTRNQLQHAKAKKTNIYCSETNRKFSQIGFVHKTKNTRKVTKGLRSGII